METKLVRVGDGWLTEEEFSCLKLSRGSTVTVRSLDDFQGYGITREQIMTAVGPFLDIDPGSVVVLIPTERLRLRVVPNPGKSEVDNPAPSAHH